MYKPRHQLVSLQITLARATIYDEAFTFYPEYRRKGSPLAYSLVSDRPV